MLDEGTKTRNALQIADEVARLGASLATASTMDQIADCGDVAGGAVSARRWTSWPTSRSIPRSRRRKSSASAPAAWRTCSRRRAIRRRLPRGSWPTALYGTAHPYGYLDLGTEASNKALTRDAMVDFWKQHIVPGNAALVVVGAISRKQLEPIAAKAFAGWTGKAAPARTLPRRARHQRKARHRRHAGRRADAGEGREHRRAEVHARLRGARGDERAARRACSPAGST